MAAGGRSGARRAAANVALHRNVELTLERAQYLLKMVAGRQANVDSATAQERSLAAQIAAAQAQLQTAQINLGYTEIRAPIGGKISATEVTEGNVVSLTVAENTGTITLRGVIPNPVRSAKRTVPAEGITEIHIS
jgi:membrane fusion protein, multidrug efflux system